MSLDRFHSPRESRLLLTGQLLLFLPFLAEGVGVRVFRHYVDDFLLVGVDSPVRLFPVFPDEPEGFHGSTGALRE